WKVINTPKATIKARIVKSIDISIKKDGNNHRQIHQMLGCEKTFHSLFSILLAKNLAMLNLASHQPIPRSFASQCIGCYDIFQGIYFISTDTLHDLLNHGWNCGKGHFARKKRFNGDFIGSVEYGWHVSTSRECAISKSRARKSCKIRCFKN